MKKIYVCLLALLFLIPATTVFAKDGFDYIVIKGYGITGDINVSTAPFLQNDSFADFSQASIPAPADAGEGYQIVRMRVDGSKGVPYDQLHYYPNVGYVYYDGIVNGYSELGGKWYLANPAIEKPFRAVLAEDARLTWIPLGIFAVLFVIFAVNYYRKPIES